MLLMSEATYFPNTVFDDDDEDADAPSTPTTLSMFRPFIRGDGAIFSLSLLILYNSVLESAADVCFAFDWASMLHRRQQLIQSGYENGVV